MMEKGSNRIILYSVLNRKRRTFLKIIKRQVKVGSTIYSDSWRVYVTLNNEGYVQFNVVHKDTYKQTYKNVATGEVIEVYTNTIEDAWKHARDYFLILICLFFCIYTIFIFFETFTQKFTKRLHTVIVRHTCSLLVNNNEMFHKMYTLYIYAEN